MSTAASAPQAVPSAHEDDGSSARGNQVMLGVLAGCIAVSVASIIVAGVSDSVFVLVFGVAVMAVAVGVMLTALSRLIGSEHETYGEA